jgi:hypothetical protein
VTPEEFLAEARRRLSEAGYAVEDVRLPGGAAIAARRKLFRLRWIATQLKTTVVVAAVDSVSEQGLRQFAAEAFECAKQIKGGLPTGLQSGIGCVAVLAANQVDDGARAMATAPPTVAWFQGLTVPALVDLTTGAVHAHDGRVLVGAIYMPFLRRQRDLVTGVVTTVKEPQ